ncbi:hypothetical protein LJC11_04395, partial [Bacteroidales bacterium OttesenSCG-928-I21]|nr:hypothetical protein [Bacteroidales bacterium OttesenSCG-928-I21]
YSGKKQTEIELRMYFCLKLRRLPASLKHNAIATLLIKEVDKTRKAIGTLHEDLQFDYGEELKKITDY